MNNFIKPRLFCRDLASSKSIRFLLLLTAAGLANMTTPEIAQGQNENRAIENGDWLTDENWEDPFGENNTPEADDPFNTVLISEGRNITISGGSASVRNLLGIGGGNSAVFGGAGTLGISGGQLTAQQVSVSGSEVGFGGGDGTLSITGGTLNSTLRLRVGTFVGTTGFFDISGGGQVNAGSVEIGPSGNGFAEINGGTITSSGGFSVGDGGTGTLNAEGGGQITTTNGSGIVFGNANVFLGGTTTVSSANNIEVGSVTDFFLADSASITAVNDIIFGITSVDRAILLNGNINAGGQIVFGGRFDPQFNEATQQFNDATLNATDVIIGNTNNSSGIQVLDFNGGTITATNDIEVGRVTSNARRGVLNAQGDSSLISANLTIGVFETSFGEVNGEDNALIFLDNDLILGSNGSGDIGGGIVRATGTLNWDSTGTIRVGNDAFIGGNGNGFADISNGTLSVEHAVFVGTGALSESNLTLTGGLLEVLDGGANDSFRGDLHVGSNGLGVVDLSNNATANLAGDLVVGVGLDSDGTVTVADNSQVVVADSTIVGVAGRGRLTVNDNANLQTGDIDVGQLGAGIGTLEITGGVLDATVGNIQIGSLGEGIANISGSASVSTANTLFVGVFDGSDGQTTISDQAQVTADGFTVVGFDDGSVGQLTVEGDANLSTTQGTSIGLRGEGALVVAGNGVVNALAGLQVADEGTAVGDVTVEDNGAINVTNDFRVSNENGADGRVSIDDNGEINVGGNFNLGNEDGTTTSLTVGFLGAAGDNPTLQTTGDFTVSTSLGDNQLADVNIIRGTVSANNIAIGNGSDNVVATVDIADGSLQASSSFEIEGGTTVNMTGGTLQSGDDLSLNAGFINDGSGTVEFNQSGGDMITGSGLNIGTGSGGNVQYTLTGGTISVGTDVFMSGESLFELQGGEFRVDGVLSLDPDGMNSTVFRQTGGTLLAGFGIFNDEGGEYDFSGGVLTTDPGELIAYFGDFEFSDSATLKLDDDKTAFITGSFLSTDVDGTLFSGGGILDLSGLEIPQDPNLVGYLPLITIGDNTNLLDFGALDQIAVLGLLAGINQRFTEFDFQSGLGNAAGFALVEGSNFGDEFTIGIAFSNPAVVPEPSSALLLLLGLATGLGRLRNRQRA